MAYAGFDVSLYPGDPMMAWLKANTNLAFCGFYLAPAPCHGDSGWMDKRAILAAQGWGAAAVYVGQQEPGNHCAACDLTSARGQQDGGQAAVLMNDAGFAAGSIVYLDIEAGGPPSVDRVAYFEAWVDAVNDQGQYQPGAYCSHTTASALLERRAVPIWTWNLTQPPPGADYAAPYDADAPGGSGVAAAVIWQYAQNVRMRFPAAPIQDLVVDFDSSDRADPSAPPPIATAIEV